MTKLKKSELEQFFDERPYINFGKFCEACNVHRNTLYYFLKGKTSNLHPNSAKLILDEMKKCGWEGNS